MLLVPVSTLRLWLIVAYVDSVLLCKEGERRGQKATEGSTTRSGDFEAVPAVIYLPGSNLTMSSTVGGGRRAGASNYSKAELQSLLSTLESVLPIGQDEWEEVAQQHATSFPGRDIDSIRRKFATLHRKQIPTGDPSMPPEVRRAKRVKYLIGDKANLGDGEEGYDLESGSFLKHHDDDEEVTMYQPSQPSQPSQTQQPTQPEMQDSQQPTLSISTPTAASQQQQHYVPASNNKRPYSRSASPSEFLDLMRMQMLREAESREADRQMMRDAFSAIATTVASVFTKKKRKRRRYNDSSSSSDSDSD